MTMLKHLNKLLLLTLIIEVFANADKVPSTDDIDDYNDPVLREVFSSSRKQSTPESQPYSVPTKVRQIYSATQRPTYEVARPTYRQPYQPGVGEAPSLSYGYSNPAADLGSLAAQGAQTFVQGAQQVGRVFGIDPSVYGGGTAAYEFPLGGGGFFGRK